jgi:hypothetical protein
MQEVAGVEWFVSLSAGSFCRDFCGSPTPSMASRHVSCLRCNVLRQIPCVPGGRERRWKSPAAAGNFSGPPGLPGNPSPVQKSEAAPRQLMAIHDNVFSNVFGVAETG